MAGLGKGFSGVLDAVESGSLVLGTAQNLDGMVRRLRAVHELPLEQAPLSSIKLNQSIERPMVLKTYNLLVEKTLDSCVDDLKLYEYVRLVLDAK